MALVSTLPILFKRRHVCEAELNIRKAARHCHPVAAQQLAWQALENLRQQQASALAYFDVFLMMAVVTLVLVPVVLLMKRSVAEKGAHIGHE